MKLKWVADFAPEQAADIIGIRNQIHTARPGCLLKAVAKLPR